MWKRPIKIWLIFFFERKPDQGMREEEKRSLANLISAIHSKLCLISDLSFLRKMLSTILSASSIQCSFGDCVIEVFLLRRRRARWIALDLKLASRLDRKKEIWTFEKKTNLASRRGLSGVERRQQNANEGTQRLIRVQKYFSSLWDFRFLSLSRRRRDLSALRISDDNLPEP